jgi:hypothetical protein
MEKLRCLDLRGRQITPQSPVLTEEAQRHKPQRFKILDIKNIINILLTQTPFNYKNLLYKTLNMCITIYVIVVPKHVVIAFWRRSQLTETCTGTI